MVKYALTLAARSRAFARFVSLLEHWDGGRANLLQVLTYHRIDEPRSRPDLSPTTISATPDVFERQMAHLAAHYHVVTMPEVFAARNGGPRLPRRAVLLTFDDAYRDFAEHAWPILRRFRLHATLFVPTAYPGHPERAFWWDRLHQSLQGAGATEGCELPWEQHALDAPATRGSVYRELVTWLKSLPHAEAIAWVERLARKLQTPAAAVDHVLNWDELRQLASDGVTLGAHTQTHPLLHRIPADVARREAAGSFDDLRREIGNVLPVFAYPGGKFNRAAVEAVRRAGFELAFAGRRGINNLDDMDPLRLRRNHIGRGTHHAVFRARLLSWSIHFNRWRPVTGR